MTEYEPKWFKIWTHGRGHKKEFYMQFPNYIYECPKSLRAEVEHIASEQWPTSEYVSFGWEEVKVLPYEVLKKKIDGARKSVQHAMAWHDELREYLRAHLAEYDEEVVRMDGLENDADAESRMQGAKE